MNLRNIVDAFRAAIGVATALMVGLSWPLWAGAGEFPKVPWLAGLPALPGWAEWGLLGLSAAGLALAAAGRAWRAGLGVAAGALGALVLFDQHRLQPWAYQFLVLAAALVLSPRADGPGLARLYVVGLYVHSGLSKLDVSFCRELGDLFLSTLLGPLGVDPGRWPTPAHHAAVLALPLSEIAVGLGLAWRATRPVALAGAVGMHAALLAILGPWGLGHSTLVLAWNGALVVEDLILFGPGFRDEPRTPRWVPAAGWWVVGLTVVLPLGERWGWYDTWPSHALYASHAERVDVSIREDDLGAYPESVTRHLAGPGAGPWRRLDLTGWSRSARGVPAYPQARAGLGVAEALAGRYPGSAPVRAVVLGRADRWTGRRGRAELIGVDAIRRFGANYRLNARPAPERPARGGGPGNGGPEA